MVAADSDVELVPRLATMALALLAHELRLAIFLVAGVPFITPPYQLDFHAQAPCTSLLLLDHLEPLCRITSNVLLTVKHVRMVVVTEETSVVNLHSSSTIPAAPLAGAACLLGRVVGWPLPRPLLWLIATSTRRRAAILFLRLPLLLRILTRAQVIYNIQIDPQGTVKDLVLHEL